MEKMPLLGDDERVWQVEESGEGVYSSLPFRHVYAPTSRGMRPLPRVEEPHGGKSHHCGPCTWQNFMYSCSFSLTLAINC